MRTGAYIREFVILGAESLVGAHSEIKGSILLPNAKAPHQNYVGDSVLGRHAARAIEAKLVADAMAGWVLELVPGGPVYTPYEIPDEGVGAGLTSAPLPSCRDGAWLS